MQHDDRNTLGIAALLVIQAMSAFYLDRVEGVGLARRIKWAFDADLTI
jgi:hypothetical protein